MTRSEVHLLHKTKSQYRGHKWLVRLAKQLAQGQPTVGLHSMRHFIAKLGMTIRCDPMRYDALR